MFAIVEQVIDDKIYVVFKDMTRKIYQKPVNLDIYENNEVEIIDGNIVSVKKYNEELYQKIKELEKQVFKN